MFDSRGVKESLRGTDQSAMRVARPSFVSKPIVNNRSMFGIYSLVNTTRPSRAVFVRGFVRLRTGCKCKDLRMTKSTLQKVAISREVMFFFVFFLCVFSAMLRFYFRWSFPFCIIIFDTYVIILRARIFFKFFFFIYSLTILRIRKICRMRGDPAFLKDRADISPPKRQRYSLSERCS
jgi:hypothetical protein